MALTSGGYGYLSADEEASPFLRALAWGLGGGLATRLNPSFNREMSNAASELASGLRKNIQSEAAKVRLM